MKQATEYGKVPFDREVMKASLDEFHALYKRRPIKDNLGGMLSPHLFATWFMAKELKPEVIIESGVWKGLGTWMLEQACPQASIYSLDLNLSKREYISERVQYLEQDFIETDWSGLDPLKVLVFFDDHQNAYTRLQQCKWFGFKHVIFEDNYPPGKGDFYTIKKILSETGFGDVKNTRSGNDYTTLQAKLTRKTKSILRKMGVKNMNPIPQFSVDHVSPNSSDRHFTMRNMDVYYEFPPIVEMDSADSPEPLLSTSSEGVQDEFYSEAESYNHICYLRLI